MGFGRIALLVAASACALGGCATGPRSSAGGFPATPAPTPPLVPAAAPQALLVETARAMVGQPYRYGGAEPGGFDCSGLVVYAAARAGIALPRTAEEQLHAGVAVARDAVRAGDLVFLRLAHKELHVGIAIDSTRFVHAPSHGRSVRIDSLEATPYRRGYLAARRVAVGASMR